MIRVPVLKVLLSLCLSIFFNSCFGQEDSLTTQMDWLVGSWVIQDSSFVEQWHVKANGLEGQVYKVEDKTDLQKDKANAVVLERLALKYVDGKIYYVAITSEHKEPTYFVNVGQDRYTYSFYNKENDFPQWIIYQRINNKTFQVIIKNETKEKRFFYNKILPLGK